MSGYRFSSGSDIRSSEPLNFRFNGKVYQGFEGDTLASALLASGVRTFGRSFKRHRPRGVFAAGVEETGALVQVGEADTSTPNARASLIELSNGLTARTQNHWPSVDFDVLRGLDLFASLIPAGFYNKTFMWPSWHWYEFAIRQTAGFGRTPKHADPDQYVERHLSVDVLVCGGGPAGLSAARTAGESGASVLLAEQDVRFGGSLNSSPTSVQGLAHERWVSDQIDALSSMPAARTFTRTRVAGLFDHNMALLVRRIAGTGPREELLRVRAKKIIVATGAIEQPLVFENNDRPGIMLLGAMQAYLHRFGVISGRDIVFAGNSDLLYKAARDFTKAGVQIRAIIDSRANVSVPYEDLDIPVHLGSMVVNTKGRKELTAVQVAKIENAGANAESLAIKCDALGVSGGLAPCVHLASHAKTPLRFEESIAAFVPEPDSTSLDVVGAAAGNFDLEDTLAFMASGDTRGSRQAAYGQGLGPRICTSGNKSNQWVDLLYDVTVADLDLAIAENYSSVEHMKRYTTNGMAVDQGKTSNLNALSYLASATNRSIPEVGVTTFRPPYMPVTLGTLAGDRIRRFYAPVRELPMHDRHKALGAEFDFYGPWRRPTCYPRPGEDEAKALAREALVVRSGVGICDGSALGKIEVRGPDAAQFLNLIYLNNVPSLKVGGIRYGLMLHENGVVFDDGVFCRLAEDFFLVSTTSANAARVFAHMEAWLQCERPNLDVTLMNATESWGNVTIAGPKARELLSRFEMDIDLDPSAFPFMAMRTGGIEGVMARIMRVSFSGELCFEVNVPSAYVCDLWDESMSRGEDLAVTPYGVETMMVLRIEKGFLHVGTDTDGQTVPDDVGWGHITSRKHADFIGKRSLRLPHNLREDRLQLVGIEPLDTRRFLTTGAHLTNQRENDSHGYVTSSCFSPTLGRHVGLGLLKGGRQRMGEVLETVDCGRRERVRVVSPVFIDPEGERLRG